MKKGTLARLEIYLSVSLFALLLAMAGYSLVSEFADRLDPRVRLCVDHALQNASLTGKALSRADAVRLCKHLEAIGALP
jgi:hypothetical protein